MPFGKKRMNVGHRFRERTVKSRIIFVIAGLALGGCVSGFEKFYRPLPGAEVVLQQAATMPSPPTPVLYAYSSNPKTDNMAAMEAGYVPIGESSFYGPANRSNAQQAIEQAKRVGAAMVLFHTQYMDTLQGVIPFTVANPPVVSTVTTTGNVNSFGSGGFSNGTFNATSTVTSPGGVSSYSVPYAVNRNTFDATYWVRQDPTKMHLGIRYINLPGEMRQKYQRNTGVFVTVVIRGTPAFRANLLEGDVISQINGEDVVDGAWLGEEITKFNGQHVVFTVLRGDQTLKIGANPQ